jgi:NADH:ubiquinone reductase (H+-translocating)
VFETDRFRLRGFVAWLLWAVIHIYLLVGFEQRVLVAIQWLWHYLTYERGARLITRVAVRNRGSGPGASPPDRSPS